MERKEGGPISSRLAHSASWTGEATVNTCLQDPWFQGQGEMEPATAAVAAAAAALVAAARAATTPRARAKHTTELEALRQKQEKVLAVLEQRAFKETQHLQLLEARVASQASQPQLREEEQETAAVERLQLSCSFDEVDRSINNLQTMIQACRRKLPKKCESPPAAMEAPSFQGSMFVEEQPQLCSISHEEGLALQLDSRRRTLQSQISLLRDELRSADLRLQATTAENSMISIEIRECQTRHHKSVCTYEDEAAGLRKEGQRSERSFQQAKLEERKIKEMTQQQQVRAEESLLALQGVCQRLEIENQHLEFEMEKGRQELHRIREVLTDSHDTLPLKAPARLLRPSFSCTSEPQLH